MTLAKKICVIGDFAVGKSSLVRRYVEDTFSADYRTTIGVKLHKFTDQITTPCGGVTRIVNLIIWDVEGFQERGSLFHSYFQGASGAIVVADVTREEAVASLQRHSRFFAELQPGCPIVAALNKIDLINAAALKRIVSLVEEDLGQEIAQTSAASSAGVKPLFHRLAESILQRGV